MPRDCVLVKAGMCFQLISRVGRNPHCYPMTLHSPWVLTRDRKSQPLKGLRECGAVLRGSLTPASWAGTQLFACPSFCALGCCPSCGVVLVGDCLLSLLCLDGHCGRTRLVDTVWVGKERTSWCRVATDGGQRLTEVQSTSWAGPAPSEPPVDVGLR